ncbi:hypothetical protein DFJ73DRAFT_784753 [Zopfochytrium polystomum]|nr:hypothetical protein DFJ73DRAFT_784753 [Zopfochytrium polystomum]
MGKRGAANRHDRPAASTLAWSARRLLLRLAVAAACCIFCLSSPFDSTSLGAPAQGLFVSAAPLPPPLDVAANNNNPRNAIFRRAGPSSQKNGAGKKTVTFATPESKTHEYTLPDGELASRRERMQKIRDKKPEARKDVAKDSERKWRTGVVKAVLGGEKYHSYVSPEAAKHTKVKLYKPKKQEEPAYYGGP